MRHAERRKETGKMLMDVTKYLLTTVLIGSFVTEKLNFALGTIIIAIAIVTFLVAFFCNTRKGGKIKW